MYIYTCTYENIYIQIKEIINVYISSNTLYYGTFANKGVFACMSICTNAFVTVTRLVRDGFRTFDLCLTSRRANTISHSYACVYRIPPGGMCPDTTWKPRPLHIYRFVLCCLLTLVHMHIPYGPQEGGYRRQRILKEMWVCISISKEFGTDNNQPHLPPLGDDMPIPKEFLKNSSRIRC